MGWSSALDLVSRSVAATVPFRKLAFPLTALGNMQLLASLHLLVLVLATTHGSEPLIWLDDEVLKLELPTSRFHYALKFEGRFCVAFVSRGGSSQAAATRVPERNETQRRNADKVLVVVSWSTCLLQAGRGTLDVLFLKDKASAHVLALSKARLYATLKDAYGPGIAGQLTPHSFTLPDDRHEFVAHLENQANEKDFFVLKYSRVHRGKGLAFVNRSESLRVARMEVPRFETKRLSLFPKRLSSDARNEIVAQHFVNDMYRFVPDRVTSTRIWVQLCYSPYASGVVRAYLFPGVSMDFGNPFPGNLHEASAAELQKALNANQHNADVATALNSWTLEEIRSHFLAKTGTHDAFDAVWDRVRRSIAAILATAVPEARSFKQQVGRDGTTFVYPDLGALLGFDIVLNHDLQPITIEVNGLPGMAPNAMNCTVPGYFPHPSGVPCKSHQIFGDKLTFIRAYFELYDDLKHKMDVRELARQADVAANASTCVITAQLLHEVVLSEMERSFALSRGFEDLSGLLYSSLRCMAGDAEACTSILPPYSQPLSKKPDYFATGNRVRASSRTTTLQFKSVVEKLKEAISSLSSHLMPSDERRSNEGASYNLSKSTRHDALMHAWHQQRGQTKSFDETSVDATLDKLCALQRGMRLLIDPEETQTRDEL